MSEVADIEILNRFRSGIESIVLGEKSESETMAGLHDFLKAHKYQPQPGQEGTLNDLRTIDRMRLVLRTNVEDARSHGQWARQQFALSAFPAWRYHRCCACETPLDWPSRWNAARSATTPDGATAATGEDDMIALVNHPLWTHSEFNDMGSPWTPFAVGSGMMTTPKSRNAAMVLGLLPDTGDDSPRAVRLRAMLIPRQRGLPNPSTAEIRSSILAQCGVSARWEGDILVKLGD